MPQVLVVTGMHRSGTSLAASLLQRAGVDVGDRLLEPSRDNPRGFFEDMDFVDFHQRILDKRGRTILVDDSFSFEASRDETEQAADLVAARTGRRLWGWKDPRTALFLDFWDARLTGARYFFVFRHPLDVLVSLFRRGSDFETVGLIEPVRAWRTYNSRILDFYVRNPERCVLVHVEGMHELKSLNAALQHKLALDIAVTGDALAQVYEPASLRATDYWARESFGILEPEASALYCELRCLADVGPPEPAAADEPDGLAAFRAVLGELRPYVGSSHRGLLLALLELVVPDVVDSGLELQRDQIRELHTSREWLDEQRLNWMRIAEELQRRTVRERVGRLLAHRRIRP